MKIDRIETLRLEEFPNLVWVQVYTDEGHVGVGETYFGARAVEAYIHERVAPYLLGKDPLAIDRHSQYLLNSYVGFSGSGVEVRGSSAIDIALWDIFGKATNLPVYQLLGGLSRDKIRIYNTCAGYQYVRGTTQSQSTANWGLTNQKSEGPYEDLVAFLACADELALSLLESDITAMKIWPFDIPAEQSGGMYISGPDMRKALEPFDKIRRAVGDKIDIMAEFHSLWNVPVALQIGRAIEDYSPFWLEDLIKMNNIDGLQEIRSKLRLPICASETLATRHSFRELLEKRATDIVMLDLCWVGGLSEGKKIATMAEAFGLPVAPHDCVGPVTLAASVHLSLNAPNALIQETVRAFCSGWYREIVTDLPEFQRGYALPSKSPGLGTALDAGRFSAKDAIRVDSFLQ